MTSALLAGAVFFVGQATPLPRGSEPAADLRGPRHQLMVADGYTAVPLKRTKSGVYWLVPCSYRGKSLQLLLDTGTADTVALDRTAARRAGLRGGDVRQVVGYGKPGASDSEQYLVSEFTVGGMKVLGLPIVATDLSDLGKLMYLDGAGPVDGLLGHELLRRHAAVIDYPAETLYLKSPWAVEGPKLAGKWQCVTAESEGQAAPPDLVQSLRVDLEDGVLNYRDDQAPRRFVVGCDPLQRLKQMDWYLTCQPGDGPLPGKYPGIYTVTADELLICICLDCSKGGERPAAFATKPGTGHSLFKFRRVR